MRLFTILTCFALLSCSTRQASTNPQSNTISKLHVDTSYPEEEEPDYRQEFVSGYLEKYQIDTTYGGNDKTYRLVLNHYCTMDSALIVPAKYNWDIQKDFVTHNFQSDITFSDGKDTLFHKIITKANFSSILYPELKSYATLLHPSLELNNDSIVLNYSISIPVTDVGVGAFIKFDKKGNFTVGER